MRKITLLFLMLVAFTFSGNAQDINFDLNYEAGDMTSWVGFMNVFNLPPPDGDSAFQFASGWGTGDLVAEDNMDGTVTLKPNRINDTANPYWQSGMLRGNKIMDANFYVQDDALRGSNFTFHFSIGSNSLNNTGLGSYDFAVTAFIKVFTADYSSVIDSDILDIRSLGAGDYSVTMDATGYTVDEHIQFGFQFIGPNIAIDPSFDAQYNALGGILIQPATLSVEQFEISEVKAFPNPTNNIWTIEAKSNIENIQLFDVIGKQVMSFEPNALSADIDSSTLGNGVYFARISAGERTATLKLIKE